MKIGNFQVGNGQRVFIIAELSANHNGSLETAINTIKAAKRAGADCIKLQTYTPDTITIDCSNSDFKIKDTIWSGRTLYNLYQEAHTPWSWHEELFNVAKNEGLEIFSSPFDSTSVDFLEKLNVPAYKIASFEITDIPLIEYVASKQKPIIISTGIAELEDIDLALETCRNVGNDQIILLKCTSSYPAPLDEANLRMIQKFASKFNVLTGLSDHTLGILAPVVATCMGACVIEKHFTLDKNSGGADSSFSLDEKEFSSMVTAVREAESAIGENLFTLTNSQVKGKSFSRSLYVVKDVKAFDVINTENIRSIRPGFGLHPKYFKHVIGKRFKKDLNFGSRLTSDDIIDF